MGASTPVAAVLPLPGNHAGMGGISGCGNGVGAGYNLGTIVDVAVAAAAAAVDIAGGAFVDAI